MIQVLAALEDELMQQGQVWALPPANIAGPLALHCAVHPECNLL